MIEDFLDPIGVSLEGFRDHMTGGWAFGYVHALGRVGVQTDLVCFSARVREPVTWRHAPTGAPLHIMRASVLYKRLRRELRDPYGWTDQDAIGSKRGIARRVSLFARHAAPYCSTPVASFVRHLRRHRYSAVLCQEYEYPRFDVCTALGRLLRVPVFATFQGGDYQLTMLEPKLRPRALRSCNGVIVASSREAARVQERYGIAGEKIAPIFNPFDMSGWGNKRDPDTRRQLGIPEEAKVVVWHGRVEMHRKGLDVLCHAWALLTERHPELPWHLLLIGEGADSQELQRRIDDIPLPRVHRVDEYVVHRARIKELLSAGDVYAFPSRHEGFPVAPIEAMASGLPLVAADAPGVTDILPDGASSGGVVVPRENGVALADELARLLTDDERREEVGRLARRRAESAFSPDSVGRSLRTFMESRGARE